MHTVRDVEKQRNYKQSNLTQPTMDFWWFIWLKDFYFLFLDRKFRAQLLPIKKRTRNFTHIIYRRLKINQRRKPKMRTRKGATREYNLKLNYISLPL